MFKRGVDDMEMASICQLDLCDLQHVDEKQTDYLVAVFRCFSHFAKEVD